MDQLAEDSLGALATAQRWLTTGERRVLRRHCWRDVGAKVGCVAGRDGDKEGDKLDFCASERATDGVLLSHLGSLDFEAITAPGEFSRVHFLDNLQNLHILGRFRILGGLITLEFVCFPDEPVFRRVKMREPSRFYPVYYLSTEGEGKVDVGGKGHIQICSKFPPLVAK